MLIGAWTLSCFKASLVRAFAKQLNIGRRSFSALAVQTAELLERRKEVLEKKINAELLRAKELLKVGNKTGTILIIRCVAKI